jgi:hypothetical protein
MSWYALMLLARVGQLEDRLEDGLLQAVLEVAHATILSA